MVMPLSDKETEQERMAEIAPMVKGPFVVLEDGRIDCIVAHPVIGDIPYTADSNDVVEHGRMIHAIALQKGAKT